MTMAAGPGYRSRASSSHGVLPRSASSNSNSPWPSPEDFTTSPPSTARDTVEKPGTRTGTGTGTGIGIGFETEPKKIDDRDPEENLPGFRSATAGAGADAGADEPWWTIHLCRGMINDVRRRAPYYLSDWLDAWDYRVVPATVYMYFANILPALAFSLDMFQNTNSHYGVNEVLLASVLGSVVFAIFAAQPLVIVGVTGPITVFNYTVYDIMRDTGVDYLGFMGWIGIWALILHWFLAVTNSCNWLRWVTRFPCDVFGFYVAFIYLQKGIQVLERLGRGEPFYLSIVAALLVFIVAYLCGAVGKSSLFRNPVRVFLKDYGTPLTIVFFTGFVHFGRMRDVRLEVLPTSASFRPTADRGWIVDFYDLDAKQVFTALPFAILLTVLFWFDHNVSSLIAQGSEFPLRKPAGFHWDLFLLGCTTGVAAVLGLPFPNGLIPQAPFHTQSLCVTSLVKQSSSSSEEEEANHPQPPGEQNPAQTTRTSHVVEQRVSNLAQGLLTLGTMSGPLLVVLHLVPQGVLAGLFFVMGVQALEANGITDKLLFLLRDRHLTPTDHPLRAVRRRGMIWLFVAVELVGFGATFAITQTIAAIGFPVMILLLIPVRAVLLPRIFRREELEALDEPTASDFTMEGIGGAWGGRRAVETNFSGGGGRGGGQDRKTGQVDGREGSSGVLERGEAQSSSAGMPSAGRRPGHARRGSFGEA